MDWPVVGAISGVAALAAGVLGIGAYIVLDSAPRGAVRASTGPSAEAIHERMSYRNSAGEAYAVPSTSWRPQPTSAPAPFSSQPYPSSPVEVEPERPSSFAPPTPERPRVQRPAAARPVQQSAEPEHPVSAPPRPLAAVRPAPEPRQEARPEPRREPPPPPPQVQDPRYAKVLTAEKIAHMRAAMRLTPEQAPHWPPIAAALHDIGRGQVEQIKRGQEPEVATGSMMRLYRSAQPLLEILRPEQKEKVRNLARSLGYANLASML